MNMGSLALIIPTHLITEFKSIVETMYDWTSTMRLTLFRDGRIQMTTRNTHRTISARASITGIIVSSRPPSSTMQDTTDSVTCNIYISDIMTSMQLDDTTTAYELIIHDVSGCVLKHVNVPQTLFQCAHFTDRTLAIWAPYDPALHQEISFI